MRRWRVPDAALMFGIPLMLPCRSHVWHPAAGTRARSRRYLLLFIIAGSALASWGVHFREVSNRVALDVTLL